MVFSRRMATRFLVLSIAALFVMTGCGKQQDTKAPVTEVKLGIVDFEKVIKAHSRYNEYQALRLQINALNYQLEANSQINSPEGSDNLPKDFTQTEMTQGLKNNQEIEINAKVLNKQAELQSQFDKKRAQLEKGVAAELAAYSSELNKEYELPLFNLKLKLKAASLSESDAKAAKAEMEKIEEEQQQKMNAKEAKLLSQLNNTLSAEYERLGAELNAYQEEAIKIAAAAELNAPPVSTAATPFTNAPDSSSQVKLTNELSALEQKIAALQEQIIADIKNKAGQIAVEKGLDTVITNTKVNIHAIDITELVIAGLKK